MVRKPVVIRDLTLGEGRPKICIPLVGEKEKDIIEKHMFPLTRIPPSFRESAIVCLVDKACAVYEFCSKKTYRTLKRRMRDCAAV